MNSLDRDFETVIKHNSDLIHKTASSALDVNLEDYKKNPENKKIYFITQYHKSETKERDNEIVDSINKNIENEFFDKIIIFLDGVDSNEAEERIKKSKKVDFIKINERLSYKFVFNYLLENFKEDDESEFWKQRNESIFVISNSDCYFTEDIELLHYLKFEDRFINSNDKEIETKIPIFFTLSRHEFQNGELKLGKNPLVERWDNEEYSGNKKFTQEEYDQLPYLEPWSSDAWIFKLNSINHIKKNEIIPNEFNEFLGTNMCELLLVNSLILSQVQVYNIGISGYIKLIHQHNSNYRNKKNVERDINDYAPGFCPGPEYPRNERNAIEKTFNLISDKNWLEKPKSEHEYSYLFLTDISDVLYEKKVKSSYDLLLKKIEGYINENTKNYKNMFLNTPRNKIIYDYICGIYINSCSLEETKFIINECINYKLNNPRHFFYLFCNNNFKHKNLIYENFIIGDKINSDPTNYNCWVLPQNKTLKSEIYKLIKDFVCLPTEKELLLEDGKKIFEAGEHSYCLDYFNRESYII